MGPEKKKINPNYISLLSSLTSKTCCQNISKNDKFDAAQSVQSYTHTQKDCSFNTVFQSDLTNHQVIWICRILLKKMLSPWAPYKYRQTGHMEEFNLKLVLQSSLQLQKFLQQRISCHTFHALSMQMHKSTEAANNAFIKFLLFFPCRHCVHG